MISANQFCISGNVVSAHKTATKAGKDFVVIRLKVADRRPNGVVVNTVEATAWGKVMEDAMAAREGSYCVIQGKISPRSYNDKNGEEKYQSDLIATNITCDGQAAPRCQERPSVKADPEPDNVPF
jgi:single-stranded DNA-binding protein